MLQLKIKRSDAERIMRTHVGTQQWTLDEMELFFNHAFKGQPYEVIVLNDERTEDETRPLLIEDTVQQHMTKERAGRRNLAAYTEVSDTSYPAYISVNRLGHGHASITAREAGNNGLKQVNIRIPEDKLAKFAEELYLSTR